MYRIIFCFDFRLKNDPHIHIINHKLYYLKYIAIILYNETADIYVWILWSGYLIHFELP